MLFSMPVINQCSVYKYAGNVTIIVLQLQSVAGNLLLTLIIIGSSTS